MTEVQPELIGIVDSSPTTRAEIMETSIPSSSDDDSDLSNVSQVKSMKMIETPRKEMLSPMFDVSATNDESANEDLALKKVIKILKMDNAESSSLESDGYPIVDSTYSNTNAIDNPRQQESAQESIPVDPSDSRSSIDSEVKSRSKENEAARMGVRSKLRLTHDSVPGIVKVRMQNTSVIEDGAVQLIYSVHLDGKPVPAETAARDMALLSPQEVALELGAPVIIQSERERNMI